GQDLPCASVALRSDEGGGAGGRRADAQSLGSVLARCSAAARPMNDAGMAPGPLAEWLAPILAARGTTLDPAQAAARERLDRLSLELAAFRAARQSTLKKLFAPPDVPRGVYLWGG